MFVFVFWVCFVPLSKNILQMCLVSCMILVWDFRSYFRLLIDEMAISQLNWVMPSGFQSLRLFCVFAHMGEESVVLQNRIWRKICVFPVVFSDHPRCAYIFIITACGRASSTNLFLDQVHQLVHPFMLKLLRCQEHAKLSALDKYTSCRMYATTEPHIDGCMCLGQAARDGIGADICSITTEGYCASASPEYPLEVAYPHLFFPTTHGTSYFSGGARFGLLTQVIKGPRSLCWDFHIFDAPACEWNHFPLSGPPDTISTGIFPIAAAGGLVCLQKTPTRSHLWQHEWLDQVPVPGHGFDGNHHWQSSSAAAQNKKARLHSYNCAKWEAMARTLQLEFTSLWEAGECVPFQFFCLWFSSRSLEQKRHSEWS